jgi:hypothetical protein
MQEVIDNAADEALAGFGKRIDVTLHADGSVSGRTTAAAFPSACTPRRRRPWWRSSSRLHAGGKFDKGKGGAYSFSGGLHGVGVSVTNALATRLEVTVWRDGQVARWPSRAATWSSRSVRPAAAAQAGHDGARLARRQVFRERRAAARADAPAAQQGRADARRDGHADQREDRRHPDLAVQGRPARLPGRLATATRSSRCSRARVCRRGETTTSPRARARPGAWPSPRKARRCARAMST